MVAVTVAFVSGFKSKIVERFHMTVEQRGIDIAETAVARIVISLTVAAPVGRTGRSIVVKTFDVGKIEHTRRPLDSGSVKKSVIKTLPRSKLSAFAETEIRTIVSEDTCPYRLRISCRTL